MKYEVSMHPIDFYVFQASFRQNKKKVNNLGNQYSVRKQPKTNCTPFEAGLN